MTDLDFNLGTYLVDDDEIFLNAITQVYELKDMEIAAIELFRKINKINSMPMAIHGQLLPVAVRDLIINFF